MSNPVNPQEVPFTPVLSPEAHPHSPTFGGEITWNDAQLIGMMNSWIRFRNREVFKRFHARSQAEYEAYLQNEDTQWFDGKYPYVRTLNPDGHPSQGYNQHDHVNEFSGGLLVGAGNHDHRGVGYGGHAFAVYHPGTSVPLRSYRVE